MRVIVTGGAGDIGRFVVCELAEAHEVVVVDQRDPPDEGVTEFRRADLTVAEEARRAIVEADAVVHLAAIPHPFDDPGERVLGVNTVVTYNTLEAMRAHGIRRGVYAGSESGTGFGIHNTLHTPLYLPIDTDHPCWPHESYGLSKFFGEIMFREYARAYAMEMISIRFVWVWLERNRRSIEELIAARGVERSNSLGAYVLPRDVARMVRQAVEHDMNADEGSAFEAYFAHAAQSFEPAPTLDLAARLWGGVPPLRRPECYAEDPFAPMFDISSAREELGFSPLLTWEDF